MLPNAVAVKTTIRFAETDLMGVVHHSAYIVWFEMGRVAWMDAVGMPYSEVAGSGHHFAVTGVQATYRASCTFGDTVEIITSVAKLRNRQVEFRYEVRNAENGVLLATGSSEHICVDATGKMTKIPVDIALRLQRGLAQLGERHSVD